MSWRATRLCAVAPEVRETIDPSTLGEAEVEHYSIPALDRTGGPEAVPASEILSAKQRLRGGEVMVSRLNPRKARVLSVPLLGDRVALASGEFVVMKPSGIDRRFLTYLLLAESTRQYLDSMVQSVTRSHQRIRPEHLMQMRLSVPDAIEQRAIADYLDAETARIDALITKKRRLLELVNERSSALVADRLSKVRGDVAHLSHVARVYSGSAFPLERQGLEDGDYPFFKVGDLARSLDGRSIADCPNWISIACSKELGCRLAPEGSVLFPKVGAALLGNQRRITSVRAAFDNNLMAVTSSKLEPRYLRYILTQVDLGELSNPGPVPSVNEGVVGSLPVVLPEYSEQSRIADELDAEDGLHRHVGTLVETDLALLVERRQALITAAVTGELDTPGVAA